MKCIICGCREFNRVEERVRDSSTHGIVKCKKCGFTQLYPLPSFSEEKEFYDRNLQSKNISSPDDLETIRLNSRYDTIRRADFVSNYCSFKDHILEIGSGDGFFLQEMEERGYDVMGLEVSKERRKTSKMVAKAKVLDINLMGELTTKEDLRKFDCVTLFHVLEHTLNPIFFLKTIKNKFIKKNGNIIIEVPNLKDLLISENKKYREFYWQRAHLFYFNDRTLTKIVEKAGFSVKKIYYIQRYGLENFMHWLMFGKPQISKPSFQTQGAYRWLEDYYKNYLCDVGKSDTIIIVAKPKTKNKINTKYERARI